MERNLSSKSAAALSIPLWFDWGVLLEAHRQPVLVPFNPTLVRLGLGGDSDVAKDLPLLSIPLWFDWGRSCGPSWSASSMLSIPLWFDWGPAPVGGPLRPPLLSIPLWFDWGRPRRTTSPLPCSLSIPLWFDWGDISGYQGSPPDVLSIPLWFDWGRPARCRRRRPNRRLSIPLWFDWGASFIRSRPHLLLPFNPTLVRLGRGRAGRHRPCPAAFQSHFGSIGAAATPSAATATRALSIPLWFDWGLFCALRSLTKSKLSIPLWFDWGLCGAGLSRNPVPAFNPTLVRLGQKAYHPYVCCLICFQSHFGSIGAGPCLLDQGHNLFLSIPLWFDWGAPQSGPAASV